MKVILKDTLKRKNISQYKLTQITGIGHATMTKLCANKTKRIDFDTLDKICEALDCEVEDILQRERKESIND